MYSMQMLTNNALAGTSEQTEHEGQLTHETEHKMSPTVFLHVLYTHTLPQAQQLWQVMQT